MGIFISCLPLLYHCLHFRVSGTDCLSSLSVMYRSCRFSAFASSSLSAQNSVPTATCPTCFLCYKFTFFSGSLLSWWDGIALNVFIFIFANLIISLNYIYLCPFPHFFTHISQSVSFSFL